MSTVANVKNEEGSHWYYQDGKPCYELPKKDGKGMKVPTLADARKLNLLPGVSTILRVLHKEALVQWLVEQACLAILTSPRLPGEKDDDFTKRILSTERVQDQESQIARDRGTEIHDGLDLLAKGQPAPEAIMPWIKPAYDAISKYGDVVSTELSIAGDGYGGRVDLIQKSPETIWIWDWKSTKKLPDPKKGGAWKEHLIQTGAYAKAIEKKLSKSTAAIPKIRTGNVYISTINQGEFVVCEHEDSPESNWAKTFEEGFKPLVSYWQWANSYYPKQP